MLEGLYSGYRKAQDYGKGCWHDFDSITITNNDVIVVRVAKGNSYGGCGQKDCGLRDFCDGLFQLLCFWSWDTFMCSYGSCA